MSKKFAWTVIPVLIILFDIWLCGYDFGQRSLLSGFLFALCVTYTVWQWFAPW